MPRCSAETAIDASWDRAAVQERMKGSYAGRFECRRNRWQQGSSRKRVLSAIDASLKRLGTDYFDLYQVHHYDAATPLDETLEAFDAVVRSGKARYVGCSNYPAWRVARALGRSETLHLARFVSVQPRYNLLFRQIERELLPLCKEKGLAVIPYNPLAGGLLTGKHTRSATPPEGTRFTLGTASKWQPP